MAWKENFTHNLNYHFLLLKEPNTDFTRVLSTYALCGLSPLSLTLSGGTCVKQIFWKLCVSCNFTPTLRQGLVFGCCFFFTFTQNSFSLQSTSQACFPEGSSGESEEPILALPGLLSPTTTTTPSHIRPASPPPHPCCPFPRFIV